MTLLQTRKMSRRGLLGAGLTAGIVAAGYRPALAADWPARPIRVMVGYGPGGLADVATRLITEQMTTKLGQPFVIDNRPTAGGIVASQMMMQAPKDGYTLMVAATGNVAMTPGLFKNVPFDPVKDLAPIGLVCLFGFCLAVKADSPMNNLADLMAQDKRNPGSLNFASTQAGTAQYVGVEMFKQQTGIQGEIVAFRTTGEVLVAGQSGQVQVVMEAVANLAPLFQSGALKPLTVTTPTRDPMLPNVPTAIEQGVADYVVTSWNGLVGPTGMPQSVIGLLNAQINDALKQPDLLAHFKTLGVDVGGGTPAQFGDLIKKDVVRWRDGLRAAHITPQ